MTYIQPHLILEGFLVGLLWPAARSSGNANPSSWSQLDGFMKPWCLIRTRIPVVSVLFYVRTMSNSDPNNRRECPRIKLSVPLEIQTDASASPLRTATADLSLSGCYIETIFPFPVGTNLDLQLSIETTVLIAATVVTCDPQVGNGIRFIRMLPEDEEALKAFLEAAQAQESGS